MHQTLARYSTRLFKNKYSTCGHDRQPTCSKVQSLTLLNQFLDAHGTLVACRPEVKMPQRRALDVYFALFQHIHTGERPEQNLGLAWVLREPLYHRAAVQCVQRELENVAKIFAAPGVLAVFDRDGFICGRTHEAVLQTIAIGEEVSTVSW